MPGGLRFIVISSNEQVAWDEQKELFDSEAPSSQEWGKIVEIGDLLTGKVSGRRSDEEINLYASNTGTGNQFAEAVAIVYEKGTTRGGGKEVPADWIMTSVKKWSDRGFFPSP